MPVTDSDISFTFSGGGTNANPDLSLGGDPSVQPIVNNRLFDDVEESEAKNGVIDYRCLYLHNDSAISSLYNAQVYVVYTVAGAVSVQLGFDFSNDRQNVTVTEADTITAGSFTLEYSDAASQYDIIVAWSSSLSTWATNFQTAIRAITNLEDVTVSASWSGTSVVFEVDFVGVAEGRYHEPMVLKAGGNNLTASGSPAISVVKSVDGGPINRIADEIDVDTTTPTNIVFTSSTVSIGDIRPLDSVPIWVRRTVPANTEAVENDGFTLRIRGDAIAPAP